MPIDDVENLNYSEQMDEDINKLENKLIKGSLVNILNEGEINKFLKNLF